MILRSENWETSVLKTLKEELISDVFDTTVQEIIKHGKHNNIHTDFVRADIDTVVHQFLSKVQGAGNTRLFPEYADLRTFYILTTEFLETGSVLISFFAKFENRFEPSRLEIIY